MNSNIQKIQNELKQKELDYTVVTILYKHTPYYVMDWLIVGMAGLTTIMLFCAIFTVFIDSFVSTLLCVMLMPLFNILMLLIFIYNTSFNKRYFNLRKLNKAINEIKNMNNNYNVFLTNHQNNIHVLEQMMKQSGSVTYGDVKKKYYEIKDELSSLKAKLNDEKILCLQKDLLN